MLMALRMMVSPALTVRPSFIVGSRTMVGASAKEKKRKTNIVIRKGRWLNLLFFFNMHKKNRPTIFIFADNGVCTF